MLKITVSVKEKAEFPFSLIEFSLPEGDALGPEDLKSIAFPEVDLQKGVVLSGRMPVWLFAFAVHHYHPACWVATFDPRLGGGVVVQRHSKDAPQIGSIVKLN